jgi:hypothetical protein
LVHRNIDSVKMNNKLIFGILTSLVFILKSSFALEKSLDKPAAKNILEVGMGYPRYEIKQDALSKDLFKKDVLGFLFFVGYERKLIPLLGVNIQFSRTDILYGKISNGTVEARLYLINRKAERPLMRLFVGVQAGFGWINVDPSRRSIVNFKGVGNHMEVNINCRTRLSNKLYATPRISFFTDSYKKQLYTDSQGISGSTDLNMNGYSYEVSVGYAF